MRNSTRGGMQSAGLNYSIYCSKCGKPAARMELRGDVAAYMHFTKKGSVWHCVSKAEAALERKGKHE